MLTSSCRSNPYDGLARYYHLLFEDWEQAVESEGARLGSILNSAGAHSVIDLTCGTGLQCVGLAKRGFDVTGCDVSSGMLREARCNARDAGVKVKFVDADLLALPDTMFGRFDFAISCGNSLSHLRTKRELRRALVATWSVLRPGGHCVIDAWDYDRMKAERPAGIYNRNVQVDGKHIVLYDTRKYHGNIVSTRFNLLRETGRGWRSAQFAMDLRMWRGEELVDALGHAGFIDIVESSAGECVEFLCKKL